MPHFSKSDIEYHADHKRRPAVNVKVHDSLAQGFAKWQHDNPDADPRFTVEWIESNLSDEARGDWFGIACEHGYEQAQEDAREIFEDGSLRVYSEGRQGGWAIIDGIDAESVEAWDAIELGKWAKWARWARSTADYTMALMVDLIYFNRFDSWQEEESERIGSAAFAPESMLIGVPKTGG